MKRKICTLRQSCTFIGSGRANTNQKMTMFLEIEMIFNNFSVHSECNIFLILEAIIIIYYYFPACTSKIVDPRVTVYVHKFCSDMS